MKFEDQKQHVRMPADGILVGVPPEHQGVADALRAAFTPARNTLPQDMEELLGRLR